MSEQPGEGNAGKNHKESSAKVNEVIRDIKSGMDYLENVLFIPKEAPPTAKPPEQRRDGRPPALPLSSNGMSTMRPRRSKLISNNALDLGAIVSFAAGFVAFGIMIAEVLRG